jgi:hypothetical protein
VAPLQCRQAGVPAEFDAFEHLRLEALLGVSPLCRDDKMLKLARTDLVRSWQEQEVHFFLTVTPQTDGSLPHRYVFEPLISYVVALANVLVVCTYGKSSNAQEMLRSRIEKHKNTIGRGRNRETVAPRVANLPPWPYWVA